MNDYEINLRACLGNLEKSLQQLVDHDEHNEASYQLQRERMEGAHKLLMEALAHKIAMRSNVTFYTDRYKGTGARHTQEAKMRPEDLALLWEDNS